MNGVQKAFTAVAGIALVTTLILPQRQTVAVINSLTGFFTGVFGTVMGTK